MSIRQLFFALCGSSLSVSAVLAGPYGSFDYSGSDRHADMWRGTESRHTPADPRLGESRPPDGLSPHALGANAHGMRGQQGGAPFIGDKSVSEAPHFLAGPDRRPLELRFGAPVAAPNSAPATASFHPIANPVVAEHLRRQGCEKLPACVIQPDLSSSAWWHFPWVVGEGTVVKRVHAEKRVSIRSARVARAVAPKEAAPAEARVFAPAPEIATARDARRPANKAPRPAPASVASPPAAPRIARAAPERAKPQVTGSLAAAAPARTTRAYTQTLALDAFISDRH